MVEKPVLFLSSKIPISRFDWLDWLIDWYQNSDLKNIYKLVAEHLPAVHIKRTLSCRNCQCRRILWIKNRFLYRAKVLQKMCTCTRWANFRTYIASFMKGKSQIDSSLSYDERSIWLCDSHINWRKHNAGATDWSFWHSHWFQTLQAWCDQSWDGPALAVTWKLKGYPLFYSRFPEEFVGLLFRYAN